MRRQFTHATLLLLVASCSDDEERKAQECADREARINEAAAQYGVPSRGACQNPAVAEPFKAACDGLARCREELAEIRE